MAASAPAALEWLLGGDGFRSKPASRALLTASGAKLHVASALPARKANGARLPVGLDAVDDLLGGGLPRGKLTEIVGRRSAGRFSIVLAALASATTAGEAAALVDRGGSFDPHGACDAGVELERLLWARPGRIKEALAAAEMLLGAGFALVAVDLGLPPLRGAAPDAAWLRLSRAAELERSALLLAAPYRLSGFAAAAVLRTDAAVGMWKDGDRRSPALLTGARCRLTLERNLRGLSAKASRRFPLSVAEAIDENRGQTPISADARALA